MANKYRGEVPFPVVGKGAFVRFDLEDLAELEETFGREFFMVIEDAVIKQSPKDLPRVLAIGLKGRDAEGKVSRIWDDLDKVALVEKGFKIGDAGKPIMEAIAQSWLGKSYDAMVEDAQKARKDQAVEAIKQAKEAADEAGIPFDEEALLNALLRPQIARE